MKKKKYTILYDIKKKGSDCLFDRQSIIWAHNDTEAENTFLSNWNESHKDGSETLNSIQDVIWPEEA